jgi:hypothetical protein
LCPGGHSLSVVLMLICLSHESAPIAVGGGWRVALGVMKNR